jgi:hypothetical protein
VGFGMLVSSLEDYRTGHINNYNAAVDTWTSSGLTTMSNYENTNNVVNVSMVFDNLDLSPKLPSTSTSESYITDSDERIQTYSQYVRFSTGAAMDLSNSCTKEDGCDVSALASFFLFVNGRNIYHGLVPAFSRVRTYGVKESHCNSGDFWDSMEQTCDSYSMISSICLKIKQTSSGPATWGVDNSYGGVGCGISSWEVASYERLRIYSSFDFPKMVYVPLSVRSVADPRVAFNNEMGPGSSSFGLTQGDKARTGVILLTIGGLMLFFLCGTVCKLMRLDKHHRYYEEVRAPVMVVAAAQPVVYYQQSQPGFVAPQPGYVAQPVYAAAPPVYPPQYQQPVYYQQGQGGQVPIAYAPTQ